MDEDIIEKNISNQSLAIVSSVYDNGNESANSRIKCWNYMW